MGAFDDKVALITGGSSGIGRAAALAFAREGAKVVIAARGADRGRAVAGEIEAEGGAGRFVAADVSNTDEARRLVETTVDAYGRLDCAFNNSRLDGRRFSALGRLQRRGGRPGDHDQPQGRVAVPEA